MEIIISIIIPVYNVEKYIERCLLSVIKQSDTTNIECIIIDDFGSDSSMVIVEDFLHNYQGNIKFKIIKHSENKGLSAARNSGIINSSGKYIYFLDSDDEILPDTMWKFKEYLNKWNDVDCLVGDVYASYPYSQWIRVKQNNEFIFYGNDLVQKHMLNRCPIPVTAWNKLIKKELIIKHKIFFKEGFIHEDELWSYFLSRYVTSYGYINYASYVYYQNPHSIITNRVKSITNKILILQLFINDINVQDIYARFRLIAEWILDIYCNISLLDDSQKGSINKDALNQATKDFLKVVLKKQYFHIALLLFPYILFKSPSVFQAKYMSKLFSRILRVLG